MKNKKVVTTIIIVATIVLGGIAVFTAVRLFQLRQTAVAPTAPESPFASECGPDVCGDRHLLQVGCEGDGTKDEQLCNAESNRQCREEVCNGQTFFCVPSFDGFAWNTDDGGLCQAVEPDLQSCNPVTFSYGDGGGGETDPPDATDPPATDPPDATDPPATDTPEPTSTPVGGGGAEGTPTATPSTLPDAGIPTPTLIGSAAGLLLILFSLMLAL